MRFGRLFARIVIGGLFMGHGLQKLFGWFDGPGIEGTSGMMENVGLHPPKRNAVAAGATETAAGAMLAAGFLTPLAAAAITSVMLTAIRTVHAPKGPWNSDGGWEYNAVLIAAPLALTDAGPGPISIDSRLGIERKGPVWTLGALAAGAAGSAAVVEAGRRMQPAAA